eukprot:1173986-Rhodomonas_salina.7
MEVGAVASLWGSCVFLGRPSLQPPPGSCQRAFKVTLHFVEVTSRLCEVTVLRRLRRDSEQALGHGHNNAQSRQRFDHATLVKPVGLVRPYTM